MDYDASTIPTVYDEARGLAPERMRQWLRQGALKLLI
jgi:hypothetical protein